MKRIYWKAARSKKLWESFFKENKGYFQRENVNSHCSYIWKHSAFLKGTSASFHGGQDARVLHPNAFPYACLPTTRECSPNFTYWCPSKPTNTSTKLEQLFSPEFSVLQACINGFISGFHCHSFILTAPGFFFSYPVLFICGGKPATA